MEGSLASPDVRRSRFATEVVGVLWSRWHEVLDPASFQITGVGLQVEDPWPVLVLWWTEPPMWVGTGPGPHPRSRGFALFSTSGDPLEQAVDRYVFDLLTEMQEGV